jgi:hypothetical protein
MTAYTEVELRCDAYVADGDPFGCNTIVFSNTVVQARAAAAEQGWRVNLRGTECKDLCPAHKAGGAR